VAREARDGNLDEVCGRLVDMANERGGEDNITVALVRWQADPAEAGSAEA
jgi:serine/threonine protein phosphatase PrpC